MWHAIILAGGTGSRMGAGVNKVLLPLGGEPVLCRSVRAFLPLTDGVTVVARREDDAAIRAALTASGLSVSVVTGGATRQGSVWNGLMSLPRSADKVLIHDGARCLVDEDTIRRVMASV